MDGASPGLQDDFEAFHARFAGLFGRSEPRALCGAYLRGLMAKVERRNYWQLAGATGGPSPDAMLRLSSLTLFRTHAAGFIVNLETSYNSVVAALSYCCRYIARPPIGDRRVVSYDGKHAVFE